MTTKLASLIILTGLAASAVYAVVVNTRTEPRSLMAQPKVEVRE